MSETDELQLKETNVVGRVEQALPVLIEASPVATNDHDKLKKLRGAVKGMVKARKSHKPFGEVEEKKVEKISMGARVELARAMASMRFPQDISRNLNLTKIEPGTVVVLASGKTIKFDHKIDYVQKIDLGFKPGDACWLIKPEKDTGLKGTNVWERVAAAFKPEVPSLGDFREACIKKRCEKFLGGRAQEYFDRAEKFIIPRQTNSDRTLSHSERKDYELARELQWTSVGQQIGGMDLNSILTMDYKYRTALILAYTESPWQMAVKSGIVPFTIETVDWFARKDINEWKKKNFKIAYDAEPIEPKGPLGSLRSYPVVLPHDDIARIKRKVEGIAKIDQRLPILNADQYLFNEKSGITRGDPLGTSIHEYAHLIRLKSRKIDVTQYHYSELPLRLAECLEEAGAVIAYAECKMSAARIRPSEDAPLGGFKDGYPPYDTAADKVVKGLFPKVTNLCGGERVSYSDGRQVLKSDRIIAQMKLGDYKEAAELFGGWKQFGEFLHSPEVFGDLNVYPDK